MNRFWIFIKELYLKQKWIFVFLFMVPFINDRYYGIIPKEQMDYLKIVSFISIIVLFVAKKKKPSIIFMSLFLLETWWLISTVVNYGMSDAMYTTLREIISVLSITLIIEFFIIDPNQLLNGLMLNYELAIYPNFIYVVLSYMTGSRYYILGYYTSLILWFLPATCVSALYIINNKNKYRGLVLLIISILSVVLVQCATATVAYIGVIVTFCLGLLLNKTNKKRSKISLSVLFLLSIALNVVCMFFYKEGTLPIIDSFIINVLKRSTTFTDRFNIWQKTFSLLLEKPLIGYGYRMNIVLDSGRVVPHAHNQYLEILNIRGIIGFVLFMLFHIVLCLKVDKSSNTNSRLVAISSCLGVFITYITEAYTKYYRLYIIFIIAYYINLLNKEDRHDITIPSKD